MQFWLGFSSSGFGHKIGMTQGCFFVMNSMNEIGSALCLPAKRPLGVRDD
jgi:hypothetical protein